MLSFELRRVIDPILSRLRDDRYLLEGLDILVEHRSELLRATAEALETGVPDRLNGARNLTQQAIAAAKKIKIRRFLAELDALVQLLADLAMATGATKPESTIIVDVQHFAELFESYLVDYKVSTAFLMFEATAGLKQSLLSLRDTLEQIQAALASPAPVESGQAHLTIVLSSQPTFPEFVLKLDALRKLCDEIRMVLRLSEQDYPIRIVKIESGSVFLDLLAYPKLVDLVVGVLKGGAAWIYRKYTLEGKVASIPREVAAVESVLGLVSELRKAGVDTESLQEEVAKAAVRVAENLNTFLDGEPRIEVNSHKFSVTAELEYRSLEEARRRQLEAGPSAPLEEN